LGYILGDVFTNSAGHPVGKQRLGTNIAVTDLEKTNLLAITAYFFEVFFCNDFRFNAVAFLN
jgi:hypothetical protein